MMWQKYTGLVLRRCQFRIWAGSSAILAEVVRPNKYHNNTSIRLQSFPSKSPAIRYPVLIIRCYIIRISDRSKN